MASHIKFLKGYGVSIRQKQNQIFITNGKEPFTNEQERETYYVTELPYEKIVVSGDGYISTNAIRLLLENNVHIILTDVYGNLITSMDSPMISMLTTRNRIGQYQTFSETFSESDF